MDSPCEVIHTTQLSPLISKCQIKVCYVGDTPNRNGSVITKDVALKMGETLPGCPIVGYFNEADNDFEEHNRMIDISNGKFEIKDTTKPYGFIAPDAKVWFQTYIDDGNVEREYLVTEGYLWTGQYPECQRIVAHGNNQSMELDENSLKAQWSKISNDGPEFFIINEAIISKLCILGENVEPCFEGANITNIQFSFDNGFKNQLFSMMEELKDFFNEGGAKMFENYSVVIGDSLWNQLYSFANEKAMEISAVLKDAESNSFAVLKDAEDKFFRLDFSALEDGSFEFSQELSEMVDYEAPAEPQFSLEEIEEFKKKNEEILDETVKDYAEEIDNPTEVSEIIEAEVEEETPVAEEEEPVSYTLEEIPEYVELAQKYSELEASYNALVAEKEALQGENDSLKQFKLAAERAEKEKMIQETFYMLNDADKAEVIAKIDEYSLKDIEAELAIICFRNQVSFSKDAPEDAPVIYNIDNSGTPEDTIPAWVKAVAETQKTLS